MSKHGDRRVLAKGTPGRVGLSPPPAFLCLRTRHRRPAAPGSRSVSRRAEPFRDSGIKFLSAQDQRPGEKADGERPLPSQRLSPEPGVSKAAQTKS